MQTIQLGDARALPFKDGYFGLAFFSPPWDNPEILIEAMPEITRVLKKRGRWAMVLPHLDNPALASLVLTNRDQSQSKSFAIPKPSEMIGPRYHSVSEELVNQVLNKHPWVDRVLDPFCGAGTIVKVAQDRGLEAYGIDNDPETVNVARLRLSQVA